MVKRYLNPFKSQFAKFRRFIKMFRWTMLDWYILKSFLASLFASLFLFVMIYQLTQIFQELKWIPQDVDSWILFQKYFLSSFYWIIIFQPFAFLFACVFVFSKLGHSKELVAVVSTGTSVFRASFYIILFTVFYYVFSIVFFQEHVVFPAYQRSLVLNEIIYRRVEPETLDKLKDNRNFSIFGANNLLYIVSYYNAISREIENITVVRFDKNPIVSNDVFTSTNRWLVTNAEDLSKLRNILNPDNINISMRIDAKKAVWNVKVSNWDFRDGMIRYVEDGGKTFRIIPISNQNFDFITDPPYYFEKIWFTIDAMTYEESRKQIDKLKASKQDYQEMLARYISKFSYPFGIILIVLAGIGIVDISRRKASFIVNLMMSVLVFLIYYLFFVSGIALAGKGEVSPEIGGVMGTAVLAVMSIILFSRTKT